nr:plastocyanin [Acaryochloris sp. IP29b_bin.148]
MGGLLPGSSTALAATATVQMGSAAGMLVFEPAEITIAPGDTVHYEVAGVPPHNVVFDPGNSAGDVSSLSHSAFTMSGGFDVAFPADAAPGNYSYYCEPHRGAGMVGKITVQG